MHYSLKAAFLFCGAGVLAMMLWAAGNKIEAQEKRQALVPDDICTDDVATPCSDDQKVIKGVIDGDKIIPPLESERIAEPSLRFTRSEPTVAMMRMSDDYQTMTIKLSREICTVPDRDRASDHSRLKRIRVQVESGTYEIDVLCIGDHVHLSDKGWVKEP